MKRRGFTLIELLIVVAIIAILAAIAVPNFLEAQTRSKVSRAKADMRSIATALEAYRTDSNGYPPDILFFEFFGSSLGHGPTPWLLLFRLTTPVAYMTSIPSNPFPNASWNDAVRQEGKGREFQFDYTAQQTKDLHLALNNPNGEKKDIGLVWSLCSWGPDRNTNYGGYLVVGEPYLNTVEAWGYYGCLYDATNGTISQGDIMRVGP
jgi:type II secretion system protein G